MGIACSHFGKGATRPAIKKSIATVNEKEVDAPRSPQGIEEVGRRRSSLAGWTTLQGHGCWQSLRCTQEGQKGQEKGCYQEEEDHQEKGYHQEKGRSQEKDQHQEEGC